MQIIENWSDIEGVVTAVHPSSDVPGFAAVELRPSTVQPVEGFPNLLEDTESKPMIVLVPEALQESSRIRPGDVLSCRVRRAAPGRIFVHREHVRLRSQE